MFDEIPGITGWGHCGIIFDDGTGPALYVGGWPAYAGTEEVNNIAKWDGTRWSGVGTGVNATVYALTVFDDGSGPALFAAGAFTASGTTPTSRIAKWDGVQWTPLGAGLGGTAYALTVYDDGTGSALYAGGAFTVASGGAGDRIAKWNGISWDGIGAGIGDGNVYALSGLDAGSPVGRRLIAGGTFTAAGGTPCNRIAAWDGTGWAPLGAGVSGGYQEVDSFCVFDDGSGSALYVGGSFLTAGGVGARGIARWNGNTWSAVGSGLNLARHRASCTHWQFTMTAPAPHFTLAAYSTCPVRRFGRMLLDGTVRSGCRPGASTIPSLRSFRSMLPPTHASLPVVFSVEVCGNGTEPPGI